MKDKPRSKQIFIEDSVNRMLAKEATPYPRDYFRASELGYCPRALYYARTGETPRSLEWGDWVRFRRGDHMHNFVQDDLFARFFVLDGVEGDFASIDGAGEDGITTFDTYIERAKERANKMEGFEWVSHELRPSTREGQEGTNNIQVRFIWKGTPLGVRFRPDGIIVGLKHPEEGDIMWPIEEHDLLEVKSMAGFSISKTGKDAKRNAATFGHRPAQVIQMITTAFFLGLDNIQPYLTGNDNPTQVISDKPQKKYGERPAWDWDRIPCDMEFVEVILDRMRDIELAIQAGEPPAFGCTGSKKEWAFMSCQWNTREVNGTKSTPMCGGIAGGS